ncbi:IS256 family transposase [Paraburkholderia sp.]|uniref:IS256 family transposase n=1 Tax=Paraburkholderia sp. TaxID=1926495 RepID=UPI0023908356|nr:IS256 family transposase [Paraburkholderia sp.]MDE1180110.1 IS256 family transposase [Paraburkholderia sp.]MDE1181043.1 IS256 family transposase [Paraburkholderia sp.]MDE1183905.1 IS256 family transposase [Paraburkholderia sp.]
MATRKTRSRFDPAVLDELLKGQDPQTVLRSQGLLGELKKALAERMLNAEMDVHLDQPLEHDAGNHRNGSSAKTVLSEDGPLELAIPRDRHGRFDPALIGKYQRRFPGFDQKIIALYARGMSTRDIQAHVAELYGLEISPELVSAVTDAVLDEVRAWQERPLDPVYALVYFDALRVKIRDEGLVRNKAVYLAIGVNCEGYRDVLGIWIEHTEGARFWLRVMSELKARGTRDILIAVVDGLKGFPEAIVSVFPQTVVQTCIVHLLRNSMQFATWKERAALAAALRPVYTATGAEAAEQELARFEAGEWGQRYRAIVPMWRRQWEEVVPFFAFTAPVRTLIYTTNAIESLHSQVRKSIRNKGHFPSDEAALKLIWLSLRYIVGKWTNRPLCWSAARTEFAIQFEDRFTVGP